MAEITLQRKRREICYCIVITLDIRNALNSVSWAVKECTIHNQEVSEKRCRILQGNFQNRVLIYDTEEGERSHNITAGVPQGSILGPVLWNVTYDDVLRFTLPPSVKLADFADDITFVVYGESIEEVELTAARAIGIIENWKRSRQLALAHHKTEVVLVNYRKSEQQAVVNTGGGTINSNRSLMLLRVMISAYRTALNNAVCAQADMMSTTLVVAEDEECIRDRT